MSKNIVIQEGGVAKQLTADKLKTNLVGSGTCLWVPEDEVQLTTKTITENGTYKASDDGYYGYEQVIVSIAGVGTATGTDGDGDEAVAHTDPGTGELVTDKVPSRIEVVTLPDNPDGIYTNGQSISTNGMVVKAYLKTGGEYGTVPNGEITLNPTTAVYDASTDYGPSGKASSDLETGLVQPISYSGISQRYIAPDGQGRREIDTWTAEAIAGFPDPDGSSSQGQLMASSSQPVSVYDETWPDGSSGHNHSVQNGQAFTYDDKTVYYRELLSVTFKGTEWRIAQNQLSGNGEMAQAAWTMIYGTKTEEQAGSHQTITVSWPRPGDGKVLETTFEIIVQSSLGGATGGGGEAGDTGAGRND